MPVRLWYLRVNGQPAGPFEPRDLRRLAADGRLGPDDRLRRIGDAKWHRATKIAGLFDRSADDRAQSPRPQRRFHRANVSQLPVIQPGCLAAETVRPRPIFSTPVIGAATFATLMIYLTVASLAGRAAPLGATRGIATPQPTIAEAAIAVREIILARTDPTSAEISGLELLRQTEQSSETSAAAFTFSGKVCWTNRMGTPVKADFGVIVRYDPRLSAYVPDLVTLDGRVVTAQ